MDRALGAIPAPIAADARERVTAQLDALSTDDFTAGEHMDDWEAALSRSGESAAWLIEHPDTIGRMLHGLQDLQLRDALVAAAVLDFPTARAGLNDWSRATALWEPALLGATGTRPRWDLINALAHVLHALAAFTDQDTDERSAVLSILAWIEWCRGRGSRAAAYLDRCDRNYPLATLLAKIIDRGDVCQWARNRDHAWSRTPESP